MTVRLVVLISGRGSNMLAIARACRDGVLAAEIVGVVCNQPDAPGIAAAEALGLPVSVIDSARFGSRAAFDRALERELHRLSPDWIILAGFMRILGAELVNTWAGRILNIHPSLLPRFPGLDTHRRAIEAGETRHGASVHLVTEALDAGPVIAQVEVAVLPGDTPEQLAERVLAEEHELYIRAIASCVGGDAPEPPGECYGDPPATRTVRSDALAATGKG